MAHPTDLMAAFGQSDPRSSGGPRPGVPSSASTAAGETTGTRGWYSIPLRWVRTGLVAYLLIILVMLFFENQMIFLPSRDPLESWRPPGLPVEEAFFQASDGTKLYGWYLHNEQPRAVVLFAYGNAGNLTYRADVLARLHRQLGLSVMAFDYRGYGRSEGSPDEAGVLADARAARAWLARRAGVAEKDVVLMGRSLGGGVMVDLAANDGCRGLILQSTYTSLPDVAAWHYPWLPVRSLMRTQFDSLSKIGRYHGPLLHSHGDADEIVPFQQGLLLHAAANAPKTFFHIPGGRHNEPQPTPYYQALDQFLDQLPY